MENPWVNASLSGPARSISGIRSPTPGSSGRLAFGGHPQVMTGDRLVGVPLVLQHRLVCVMEQVVLQTLQGERPAT